MPPRQKAAAKAATEPEAAPSAASAKAAPAADPQAPTAPQGPAAPEASAAAEDPAAQEFVPTNRAERRAKGKNRGMPQPAGRGKVFGGHGPASSQRMWANRRSGG